MLAPGLYEKLQAAYLHTGRPRPRGSTNLLSKTSANSTTATTLINRHAQLTPKQIDRFCRHNRRIPILLRAVVLILVPRKTVWMASPREVQDLSEYSADAFVAVFQCQSSGLYSVKRGSLSWTRVGHTMLPPALLPPTTTL